MEQKTYTFSEATHTVGSYSDSEPCVALKLLFAVCFAPGIYVCSKCDHQLFSSRSKFEHSSPWPAFTETIHENSVSKHEERPGTFKVQENKGKLKEMCWLKCSECDSCLWCLPSGSVWEMWKWTWTRVCKRWAVQGSLSLLNIQQLTEVHA